MVRETPTALTDSGRIALRSGRSILRDEGEHALVEIFRCPTCIGILVDARATRCPNCKQSLRRKRPRVLGEETRLHAANLPLDRWMLARLYNDGRRRQSLPPVAWHGRFTTSPLAEPAFASTPSPIATPLAPPSAPDPVTEPASITPPEEPPAPATIGALALDVYTHPVATPEPGPVDADDHDHDHDEIEGPPPVATWTPPAPLAVSRPVVPHEDLDPDVRAIVDDLYEQARAELSGTDLTFFAPIEHDEPIVESQSAVVEAEPIVVEAEPEPRPRRTIASQPPRTRGGWVPAFTPDERRPRR
jgi:hypothetical protein